MDVRGDPSIEERLRPCSNNVEPFDERVSLPGITLAPARGHTPGSTVIVFSSQGRRVIILGDVAHSPVQLLEREWNTLHDVDPALARRTRQRLLRELEGDGPPMVGMHFPGLRFGRLIVGEGRRSWVT